MMGSRLAGSRGQTRPKGSVGRPGSAQPCVGLVNQLDRSSASVQRVAQDVEPESRVSERYWIFDLGGERKRSPQCLACGLQLPRPPLLRTEGKPQRYSVAGLIRRKQLQRSCI